MMNGYGVNAKKVWPLVKNVYTRNGWGRFKTTLETSGEELKLHSERVCFQVRGTIVSLFKDTKKHYLRVW